MHSSGDGHRRTLYQAEAIIITTPPDHDDGGASNTMCMRETNNRVAYGEQRRIESFTIRLEPHGSSERALTVGVGIDGQIENLARDGPRTSLLLNLSSIKPNSMCQTSTSVRSRFLRRQTHDQETSKEQKIGQSTGKRTCFRTEV